MANRHTEQMEGSNEADSGESVETLGQKSSESKHESPVTSYSASTAASHPVASFASRLLAGQALEEYCLGLLLDYPPVWAEIQGILTESDFTMTEARALFRAFDSAIRDDPGLDGDTFVTMLPEELRPAALRARERITRGRRLEGQAILKDASIAAYRLKLTRLKEEMAELDYLERDAEQSGDSDTLRTLLARKQHLFSQRRAVDAASRLQG
jgi:hypothetical protein